MRKRVQIALAVLLVTVAGVVGWQVHQQHEPIYQSKPVSEWAVLVGSGFFTLNSHVTERDAIEHIGINGLPTLTRMLSVRDSLLKQKVMAFANKQSIIRIYFTPAEEYRRGAAAALGLLGPLARSSVPALAQALKDDDALVEVEAAWALQQIDREAATKAGVK